MQGTRGKPLWPEHHGGNREKNAGGASCVGLGRLSSVQFCYSFMPNSVIPRTAARQASLSITNSQSFLKLMSIESVMPFNHLILCCPLLLPSIFPSIRVFPNESVLRIRWPKYWSFSFSISPSVNIQDSTTICSINPAPVCLSKGGEIRILRSIFRRRQWHPTPVLLPGESQGWGNLVGPSVGSLRS